MSDFLRGIAKVRKRISELLDVGTHLFRTVLRMSGFVIGRDRHDGYALVLIFAGERGKALADMPNERAVTAPERDEQGTALSAKNRRATTVLRRAVSGRENGGAGNPSSGIVEGTKAILQFLLCRLILEWCLIFREFILKERLAFIDFETTGLSAREAATA